MTGTARSGADAPVAMHRTHRLRTKLIVAMLALLAAICASVGVVSHLAMNTYLTAQIDSGLHQAAARSFGPKGPPPGSSITDPLLSGQPNPLDARGQRPGTLLALFVKGVETSSAVVQTDGSTVPLTTADLLLVEHLDPTASPRSWPCPAATTGSPPPPP